METNARPGTTVPVGTSVSWLVPLARGVIAIVLAVVVAFSADHSSQLGLLAFGAFGVLSGVTLVAGALRLGNSAGSRTVTLTQGLVTSIAGVVALALPGGGLPFFVFVLTAFAAITGLLEFYLGFSERTRDRSARDWMFAGALTAILAIAVLLVPPGFLETFTGPDGVQRELTASVVVVGLLGAYGIVLGVYLVLAAVSIRWPVGASRGLGSSGSPGASRSAASSGTAGAPGTDSAFSPSESGQ